MLDSPKEELKVIHEISANFVEKANIKNARLVVTKPEIADFLRGAVREVPELESRFVPIRTVSNPIRLI